MPGKSCLKALWQGKLRDTPPVSGISSRGLAKTRKSLVFQRFGSFRSLVRLTHGSRKFLRTKCRSGQRASKLCPSAVVKSGTRDGSEIDGRRDVRRDVRRCTFSRRVHAARDRRWQDDGRQTRQPSAERVSLRPTIVPIFPPSAFRLPPLFPRPGVAATGGGADRGLCDGAGRGDVHREQVRRGGGPTLPSTAPAGSPRSTSCWPSTCSAPCSSAFPGGGGRSDSW